MRRMILAVAVVVVIAAIAIVSRSQLDDEAAADVDTLAATATSSAASRTPSVPVRNPPVVVSEPPRRTDPQTPAPTRPYLRDVPNVADDARVPQATTGGEVLRRASAAYAKVKSLRASFVQKRENPLLGSTFTGRGTLYQKRPDRFLMKFSEPAGDVIVSDGRYFWLYYPSADAKQVLRADASANGAGGVDLQAQFLGDPLRRFTHSYHGEQVLNGRKTHVVTMVPRENLGYKSLKVWIDAQDALVRRFVLTEANGLVQEFTLSNLALNPTLSNDIFAFTPPPNAKIIENP